MVKRLLSAIIVIAMLATSFITAFAASPTGDDAPLQGFPESNLGGAEEPFKLTDEITDEDFSLASVPQGGESETAAEPAVTYGPPAGLSSFGLGSPGTLYAASADRKAWLSASLEAPEATAYYAPTSNPNKDANRNFAAEYVDYEAVAGMVGTADGNPVGAPLYKKVFRAQPNTSTAENSGYVYTSDLSTISLNDTKAGSTSENRLTATHVYDMAFDYTTGAMFLLRKPTTAITGGNVTHNEMRLGYVTMNDTGGFGSIVPSGNYGGIFTTNPEHKIADLNDAEDEPNRLTA